MNELEMQKMVVDAVKGAGGYALKMSNRFLVGVPDLLIHMGPDYQTVIAEVKRQDFSNRTIADEDRDPEFKLDVSVLQAQHLRAAASSGMPSAVISFVQSREKGRAGLWMAVYDFTVIANRGYLARLSDHVPLGGKESRANRILQELTSFLKGQML